MANRKTSRKPRIRVPLPKKIEIIFGDKSKYNRKRETQKFTEERMAGFPKPENNKPS